MDSHLKKNPLRRGLVAALAAAALLVPSVLAGPAVAEEGDTKGDLVVSVLDGAGRPANGIVALVRKGESTPMSTSPVGTTTGVYEFDDLPVGRYGILTLTPWGGFSCAGLSPCDYRSMTLGGALTTTGVVDVTDVEAPARYTLRTAVPAAVTGSGIVGGPLAITWSPGMTNLLTVLGAVAAPAVQWLRNGVPIPGAVGTTYTTTGADQGRTVTARLSYVAFPISPTPPPAYVLGGRRIVKAKSRTTVDVFRKKVVEGRSPGLRIDVTAGNLPATGKVKIKVGKHTFKKTLRNGSARVPVPGNLKPGRYKVVATYLGSSSYNPSKGTGRFTVVRKG